MPRARLVHVPVAEFSQRSRPVDDPARDVVTRTGVIFKAGSFPDQDFTLSRAELLKLAREFRSPIDIDHGHPTTRGPLDGAFGRLVAVRASADGSTLYGTTELPGWLERKLGDARRLVSASFNRATKKLRRLSLVTDPHFSEAELQVAFSAATATLDEPAATLTTDHVRTPADGPDDPDLDPFAPDDDEDPDMADAETSDGGEPSPYEHFLEQTFALDDDGYAKVLAFVAGGMVAPAAAEPAPTPAEFSLRAELTAERVKSRDREVVNFSKLATLWADAEIAAGRVLPAERDRLIDVHVRAATDDLDSPAEFGATKRTSRVAELEATFGARPAHGLTEEKVADFCDKGKALDGGAPAGGGGGTIPVDRLATLLAATPGGKAAWAAQKKKSA